MFTQSTQVPNYSCATGFNAMDPSCYANWGGQSIMANAILQNELLNKIKHICASDFYGLAHQSPVGHINNLGHGLSGYNTSAHNGLFGATGVCPVSMTDNDTEVCFECVCPGVVAENLDVCVVNNEIRVRLLSGSTKTKTTSGSKGALICCFALPNFCDASKCTAKVENGCLLITCPRTAEYIKNITRVKVC